MAHKLNQFEDFEKLNFVNMTDVSLAKWLRDSSKASGSNYALTLEHALSVVKALRVAYKLGEIRGKALK